jgi:hypothetical protein
MPMEIKPEVSELECRCSTDPNQKEMVKAMSGGLFATLEYNLRMHDLCGKVGLKILAKATAEIMKRTETDYRLKLEEHFKMLLDAEFAEKS